MKNRVVIMLIPVAIIGIWIGFKILSGVSDTHQLDNLTVQNPSQEDNSVELDTSSSTESNLSEQSPSSQVIKKELAKTISDIRSAKNATQAQDLIAQARSDGNQYQAAWAENELTKLCGASWGKNAVSGDIRFNEQAVEKIAEYCDGWYPSHTDEELEQALSSSSDPAFNRADLYKLLAATEPISRPELIQDLIDTARTPTELGNVFSAILELNSQEPVYSSLGLDSQINRQDFQDAMLLTKILVSCQLFSGCEPDSLFMLSVCATGPACPPDSTFQDMATYASSAYLHEQADIIYRFLLSRRGG